MLSRSSRYLLRWAILLLTTNKSRWVLSKNCNYVLTISVRMITNNAAFAA